MTAFETLTIVDVRRETDDAISVALAVPPGKAAQYRFKPGQHLAVRVTLDGEEIRRTYSLCPDPGEPHLRIAIKRIPDGRFSTWAHATLAPGMSIEAMPPAGRFTLPPADAPRHLLAVAAGAGITPIIAMIRAALETEPQTHVTLLYGNRTMADAIFRAALEDLKDRHLGRFALHHVLSREDTDAPRFSGRITPDRLQDLLAHLLPAGDIAHAFICGPGTMIRDLRDALVAFGLPREKIHQEFFAPPGAVARVAPPASTSSPRGAPHEIVAVLDGIRHRIEARDGEAVLDAALRAGIRAPYSCKGGMCCTCRARIVEGEARMLQNYSLEPWELEKGFTLTCQAVPLTTRLVIDYDQM